MSRVVRSRQLSRGAVAVIVAGLAAAVAGDIWNAQPVPPEDGANIGAGALELLGIVVVVAGIIMLVIGWFRPRRTGRLS